MPSKLTAKLFGRKAEPAEAHHLDVIREKPERALAVLEADQLVAAKQRTRFGRRRLSLGDQTLLWGLRGYVLIMLVLVVVSVLRALR